MCKTRTPKPQNPLILTRIINMDPKEIPENTFIEKAVASMWQDFIGSHEKLIGDSVSKSKVTLNLTEQDVQ